MVWGSGFRVAECGRFSGTADGQLPKPWSTTGDTTCWAKLVLLFSWMKNSFVFFKAWSNPKP